MKPNLLIAFFISLSFNILAQTVTIDEAKLVAHNWYYEHINQQRSIAYSDVEIKEVFITSENGLPLQYAVNMYPKGFVLVSGCKNMVPVAGYSFESWFANNPQPENFKAWNKQYIDQARYASSSKGASYPEVATLWERLLTNNPSDLQLFKGKSIEPLTVANWNQDWPYNEMCPADGSGPHGHCYAGCVPTAMGMIMYYYRWPYSGTGSYSYVQEPYGTLSADFGNSIYDFNQMTNSISDSDSAIAQLLYHLGVSCDLVYGPNGSGMYNHKAAYAFKTFFKYAPETQYLYRDSTNLNWDSVLVAHLDRKLPMYYAGWDVPNISGHAFVCDGYQGTNYFHFNFGWGGSSNGYFYTSNLTPGGSNFNLAQEVIINCHPDTINYTYPEYCSGAQSITNTVGSLEDGSGPRKDYSGNSNCTWLIDPQDEQDSVSSITLNFSRFNLHSTDVVKVYDGGDASAALLASCSGNNLPTAIQSSGNKMFVTFTSDGGSSSSGFLATFESEKPTWCYGTQVFTEASGTLEDGSGDFAYYNTTVCLWKILPDNNPDATAFYFTKFDTENEFDKFRLYDLGTGTMLAEYSGTYGAGNMPAPVISTSGKLYITFSTNGSVRRDGWEGYWETYLTGIDNERTNSALVLMPNPAKDILYIMYKEMPAENSLLTIRDLQGRCIQTQNQSPTLSNTLQLDISALKKGMYLLETSDGKVKRYAKFVKE